MILKILYAVIGISVSAIIPLLMLHVAIKYANYQNNKDGK